MKKMIALLLAFAMLLSVTACASKGSISDAADKLHKLPVLPDAPEKPEEPEKPETPEDPEKPEEPEDPEKPEEPEDPEKDKHNKHDKDNKNDQEPEFVDPEPSQGLDAYDNPPDHPHEGFDLTVFDGVYRANLPQGDDEETWLEITGFNDFIMLEYHGFMDGSVYRYWAEEFWPGEGWYTSTKRDTMLGKSQQFTSMAQYENYSGLPQNRCITLTEDGVVLNYDDSDAEYFTRDDGFAGGHADRDAMREALGDSVHLDFEYQYDARDVLGTWAFWTGWDASFITFREDGTFTMVYKKPNNPIAVYLGVYGFGENSGNLEIMAERIGYGNYPYYANWEWSIDEWGDLNIYDYDEGLLDGEYWFWPVENEFFTVMDADMALGYIVESYFEMGSYTDQYGNEYSYYYSLPNFYESGHRDLKRINQLIDGFYWPIIETELNAMEVGEFLTYDYVDWQSACYNGILFFHVFAYTYDWEEHAVFYIDLETMEELSPEEMLERMGIGEDEFVETARVRAEDIFVSYFSEIPEEDRDAYGYYECLEDTLSDDNINLDIPIFVDNRGDITVYLPICSMAGSGLMWFPENIFYTPEIEDSVG